MEKKNPSSIAYCFVFGAVPLPFTSSSFMSSLLCLLWDFLSSVPVFSQAVNLLVFLYVHVFTSSASDPGT